MLGCIWYPVHQQGLPQKKKNWKRWIFGGTKYWTCGGEALEHGCGFLLFEACFNENRSSLLEVDRTQCLSSSKFWKTNFEKLVPMISTWPFWFEINYLFSIELPDKFLPRFQDSTISVYWNSTAHETKSNYQLRTPGSPRHISSLMDFLGFLRTNCRCIKGLGSASAWVPCWHWNSQLWFPSRWAVDRSVWYGTWLKRTLMEYLTLDMEDVTNLFCLCTIPQHCS